MSNSSEPLLRFVQLRRAGDPSDTTPGACTKGPALVGQCFDFRDDWSKEVAEAVTAKNRQQGGVLYKQRLNGPGDLGMMAARLALDLLKQATIDERLTVSKLRERMRAWSEHTGLPADKARQAIELATTWAVDILTLRRWLLPTSSFGTSEAGRVLRGMVLVRLAQSKAEDACRVQRLTFGQELQLPPLSKPERTPDDLREKADRFATQSLDLVRMQNRWRAIARRADPTLSELREAGYKDLEKSVNALELTATELGLPRTTTLGSMQRVLDDQVMGVGLSVQRDALVVIPQMIRVIVVRLALAVVAEESIKMLDWIRR